MSFLAVAHGVWLRFHSFAEPQVDPEHELESIEDRERLRRGRLLATFLIISLLFGCTLMIASIYTHPAKSYTTGLVTGVAIQMLSILPNRRGRVELASVIYLSATIVSCVMTLFIFPQELLPACVLLYGFYLSAVIQAGFLIERRAPMVIAAASVIVIYAHIYRNPSYYHLPIHVGELNLFTIVAFGAVMMITLSLLIWVTAGDMEHAISQADRTQQVERLYADLKASHEALESRNQEINAQAGELASVNSALLATQGELQHSNRRLEALNRHLAALAAVDSMTGLANHRAFQQSLRSQISQAYRHGHELALFMLDVDRFKEYNDRFGHPAGDSVLRTIGKILVDVLRESDLPARYGGEEFAVILPVTGLEAAMSVADRIMDAMGTCRFAHASVTVSIGVAALRVHASDADGLLHQADVALYRAKNGGRCRVAVAPTPESLPVRVLAELSSAGPNSLPPETDGPPLGMPELRIEPSDHMVGIDEILEEPSGPVLAALLAALDLRDAETLGHSQRVARYAMRLARAMAISHSGNGLHARARLTDSDLRDLAIGALLHDIGKIQIPDEILRKPGPLSFEEWQVMREHPVIGAQLVAELPLLARALPVVRHHHERWDGHGYPDHLASDSVPLVARIFAICDAFDAITTDRPYRQARSYAEAREEIAKHSGTQFDPAIVEVFLAIPEAEWLSLSVESLSESLVKMAA